MPDPGDLVIIGGHEDREGDRVILRAIAARLQGRALMVLAAASSTPDDYLELYRGAFADLEVDVLPFSADGDIEQVGGVFMSGGNQNRLMDAVSGTESEEALQRLWRSGAVIGGTSAGASVMSDLMMSGGPSSETPTGIDISLAPGLGLVDDVIIDQHFAERGRMGRLITAVERGPHRLGIGIDEDTAAVVSGSELHVIGAGAVYIVDPAGGTIGARAGQTASAADLRLHLLSTGDHFDLVTRTATLAQGS